MKHLKAMPIKVGDEVEVVRGRGAHQMLAGARGIVVLIVGDEVRVWFHTRGFTLAMHESELS